MFSGLEFRFAPGHGALISFVKNRTAHAAVKETLRPAFWADLWVVQRTLFFMSWSFPIESITKDVQRQYP